MLEREVGFKAVQNTLISLFLSLSRSICLSLLFSFWDHVLSLSFFLSFLSQIFFVNLSLSLIPSLHTFSTLSLGRFILRYRCPYTISLSVSALLPSPPLSSPQYHLHRANEIVRYSPNLGSRQRPFHGPFFIF